MSIANENFFLQIFVDAYELPLQTMPLVKLALHSRLRTHVPVGELVLSDPLLLNNRLLNISDGTPISIRVGTSSARSSLYKFRAFKPKSLPSESSDSVHVSMYADHPDYWLTRTTKPFEGNSSALIEYVAGLSGLIAKVDATGDSQIWLPMNKRLCEFVDTAARAGYISDKSCMQHGVRLDRTLVYKNVDDLNYSGAAKFQTGLYGDPGAKLWPCLSYRSIPVSGYANSTGGYAATQVSDSLVVDDVVHKEVTKSLKNSVMYMNTNLADKYKGNGRVSMAPIDAGNTHAKYQQALYQNKRSSAINSGRLDLVTNQWTELDLIDTVITALVKLGTTEVDSVHLDDDASGKHYVGAKSVYLDLRGNYYERFTLIRDGHSINKNKQSRDK